MQRPSAIESEAHLGVVSWVARGPLFVNGWWEAPTVSALRELGEARLVAAGRRGRLAVVTMIRPRVAALIGEEARKEVSHWREKLEPTYLSHAYLLVDAGFMSAIVRSLLAGFDAMTARSGVARRVFSEPPEAAEFTSRQLANVQHRIGSDTILELIEYVSNGAP